MLEILLCHLKHITGICEEHITPLYILCHVLILALLEILKFLGIVSLYPTSLVQVYRLPTALGVVLMFKPVLYDFKLKLPYRADYPAVVELVDEQLRDALVHELLYTLLELFGLHRVVVLDVFEQLRRE